MAEKKRKKAKPVTKSDMEKPKGEPPDSARDEGDEKMNFGGLPDRDLKKNMGGCG